MFEDIIMFKKLQDKLSMVEMLQLKFLYILERDTNPPLNFTDYQRDYILDSLKKLFKED